GPSSAAAAPRVADGERARLATIITWVGSSSLRRGARAGARTGCGGAGPRRARPPPSARENGGGRGRRPAERIARRAARRAREAPARRRLPVRGGRREGRGEGAARRRQRGGAAH